MNRYSLPNIRRFATDVLNCARIIKNPLNAYGYLRSGRKPDIANFHKNGLKFQARKEDWVAVREVLVEDEYACIDRLFSKGDSPKVLDIGANIGCFGIRVFMRYPSAQVVSVEAADDTYRFLDANRKANSSLNWKTMNYGLWKYDEPLTLLRRGVSVGHRVLKGDNGDAVQGLSPSTLMKKVGWDNIDIIKMDIEGGEEAVIPAAYDLLKHTRILIIEVHTDRIDPSDVMSILQSVYSYYWQLNDRRSTKPLYIMANEPLDLGDNIENM